MSRLRVVHLLDDFELGGVLKGLKVFDCAEVAAVGSSRVQPVAPARALAPHLKDDVIVTHFPPSWKTLPFLASLRLRNRHARLIHVEHSYTRAWETLKVSNQPRFRRLLRIAYRLFDQIVAVSDGQAAWLREAASLPRDRVTVIYPWSGPQNLDMVAPVAPSSGRPIVIGAYGRFAEQKGFDTLIGAMLRLPSTRFRLLLGGFGPEDATLRRLAGSADSIEFVGKVIDIGAFIGRCDAIVVPSRWEAFGQVATEAREAGRAILVADVDGLPEQAQGAGIATDCSDVVKLAGAIEALAAIDLSALGSRARLGVTYACPDRAGKWARLFRGLRDQARAPEALRIAQPMRMSPGQ